MSRRVTVTEYSANKDGGHLEGDSVGQPLAVRPDEAAALLRLSRSAFYQLLSRGEIPSVRVGRARLIPITAIRKWLDQSAGGRN